MSVGLIDRLFVQIIAGEVDDFDDSEEQEKVPFFLPLVSCCSLALSPGLDHFAF